jgi:hypothetical protein
MKINFTRVLFAAILLASMMAYSQSTTQNPRWTIPGKYVQLSPSASATVLPTASPGYGNTYSGNPSNIIADNGVPLAFVVDGVTYNANGYKITDTKSKLGRTGVTPGHAEVCVVPNPANCNQYYIFSSVGVTDSADIPNSCSLVNSPSYVNAPVFQLIDMSQQDPTSGVPTTPPQYGKNVTPALTSTYTAQDLYLYTSTPASISDFSITCSPFYGDIHYAASRVRPDGSRLVFLTNNFEIIVYKLTTTDSIKYLTGYDYEELSDTGNATTIGGTYYGEALLNRVTSELEIHEDSANNKIKVAFDILDEGLYIGAPMYEGDVALVTFPYKFTTPAQFVPLTSDAITISSCHVGGYGDGNTSGIEFSPDGNTVYVCHSPSACTQNYLEAYSFASPSSTPTVIVSSGPNSDFVGSQLEIGNDGSLWVLGEGGPTRFAKLTSPNTPNAANFTDGILSGSLPTGYFGTYPRFWLPDQIDQEVYGAQFTASTSCCLFYSAYDKFTYNTASGAPTWTATTQVWTPTSNPLNNGTSSTVTIGGELRVATGYTVTIRNMTIKFSPQATLIVEGYTGSANGGTLILRNCTLDVDTRCENKLWPGVRIWGDSVYSRTNTSKGYLSMDSSCVVTNAWVGVELGYDSKYAATLGAKPADTVHCGGGNIFCQNSSFINNQRDVVFDRCQYTTGGTSSVYTSTLTTTASLLGGASPTKHIQFKDYKINALLKGLTITCGSGLSYNIQDTGIYAYNSNFNIDISNTTWNSISNMYNGIYAINSGGTTTFTAKHTVFTNNVVGENIEAVNNSITENDTFKIYNRPSRFGSPTNCSGIFSDNSTGYYIQDNYFTRNSTGFSNLYGIVANNSGPYANAIFRNTFANLYKGNQAQYRNYVATGQSRNGTGLIYLCNIFANNTITAGDIYVPATGSSTNVGGAHTDTAGVGNLQGDPAAGVVKSCLKVGEK